MELKDSLIPFRAASALESQNHLEVQPKTRIALLTERWDLREALQQSIEPGQVVLTQLRSIDLVKKAIDNKFCDLVIVDIERCDQWPGVVFSCFDELAEGFPIIILCKNKSEVLNYRWKALYAFDIYSYESVHDPRFGCLISAAMLRTHEVRDIGLSDDWDWTPPTAA